PATDGGRKGQAENRQDHLSFCAYRQKATICDGLSAWAKIPANSAGISLPLPAFRPAVRFSITVAVILRVHGTTKRTCRGNRNKRPRQQPQGSEGGLRG